MTQRFILSILCVAHADAGDLYPARFLGACQAIGSLSQTRLALDIDDEEPLDACLARAGQAFASSLLSTIQARCPVAVRPSPISMASPMPLGGLCLPLEILVPPKAAQAAMPAIYPAARQAARLCFGPLGLLQWGPLGELMNLASLERSALAAAPLLCFDERRSLALAVARACAEPGSTEPRRL